MFNGRLDFHQDEPQRLTRVDGDLSLSRSELLLEINRDKTPATYLAAHFSAKGHRSGYAVQVPSLRHVEGTLYLNNAKRLKSISGFEALEQVDGFVQIERNRKLESVSGFNRLDSQTVLSIRFNKYLADLSGFNRVERLRGFLFHYNRSLVQIDGFKSLRQITDHAELSRMPELTSLNFLEGVESLCCLHVILCPALTDLGLFASLHTVHKEIEVVCNKGLQTLNGFNSLVHFDGRLTIAYNNELRQIGGFNQVKRLKRLVVSGCPKLERFDGLQSLESVERLEISLDDRTLKVDAVSGDDVRGMIGSLIRNKGEPLD